MPTEGAAGCRGSVMAVQASMKLATDDPRDSTVTVSKLDGPRPATGATPFFGTPLSRLRARPTTPAHYFNMHGWSNEKFEMARRTR